MRYYLFNKPPGCVTAVRDEKYRTVMYYFPTELQALHPVGRLDMDSAGLLIMTDDGRVDRAILDPEHHLEKVYRVWCFGDPDDDTLRRVENGVVIRKKLSRPAVIRVISRFEVADMEKYMPAGRRERYMKNPHGKAFCAEVSVCEGRKHQVKLMIKAAGCTVCRLQRISVGNLCLGELPEGEYRPFDEKETEYITSIIERYTKTADDR